MSDELEQQPAAEYGYRDLLVTVQDGVATIVLNKPEVLNALSWFSWRELELAFGRLERDDAVRAIVLTGKGRGFCSGTDLSGASQNLDLYKLREILARPRYAWILAIAGCTKPTIAAINGAVAGSGLSLALACDIRYAAASARLHPVWTKRGLAPDMGASYFLRELVGYSRAIDILYRGDGIAASEALSLGLVNRVLADDELLDGAIAFASGLAQGPTVAFEVTKRLLGHQRLALLSEQIIMEEAFQSHVQETFDAKEGRASFKERRTPAFTGH